MAKVDHVLAGEKWAFDGEVADAFDDMLRRSIPQYDIMRQSSFDLGCKFVKPDSAIVDLGCSRGEALAPYVECYGQQCSYVGIEVSEPMLSAARQRFVREMDFGYVKIKKMDLRADYPQAPSPISLVLCVLTLLFVPIEYRQGILRKVWKSLAPGGALIFVEKVLACDAELSDLFIAIYLDMKRSFGYSEEEIQRKKLALEGVQVPVTAAWNQELLRSAGFDSVDCFWRWFNFAGWIAVKSP